jgi:hypothetical protein
MFFILFKNFLTTVDMDCLLINNLLQMNCLYVPNFIFYVLYFERVAIW